MKKTVFIPIALAAALAFLTAGGWFGGGSASKGKLTIRNLPNNIGFIPVTVYGVPALPSTMNAFTHITTNPELLRAEVTSADITMDSPVTLSWNSGDTSGDKMTLITVYFINTDTTTRRVGIVSFTNGSGTADWYQMTPVSALTN